MGGGWRVGARGRPPALAVALVVLALLGGACEGEPNPTVINPPNPTTAPLTTLAACQIDPGHPTPAPADGGDYHIAQAGILTVGSVPSTPPFESLSNGQPQGFDVDLIAEVAHRLGLRPEIQGETVATVLSDVVSGKTDVAISGLTIQVTPRTVVDFTDPYFTSNLALAVAVNHARNFKGLPALAGQTVGVLGGSYAQVCAEELASAPGQTFSVKTYSDISQAYSDVAAGTLAAVMADVPTNNRLVQAVIGLQTVEDYAVGNTYGIAVAKTNPDLRVALNRVLSDMRADGTYTQIYEKWFQVAPPSPAPSPTAS